jgi:hypothetical protein
MAMNVPAGHSEGEAKNFWDKKVFGTSGSLSMADGYIGLPLQMTGRQSWGKTERMNAFPTISGEPLREF